MVVLDEALLFLGLTDDWRLLILVVFFVFVLIVVFIIRVARRQVRHEFLPTPARTGDQGCARQG